MPAQQQLIIDVIDKHVLASFAKFNVYMPEHIRVGLIESMEHVGLISTSKYMHKRSVTDTATGAVEPRRSVVEKLGIVGSELSRSILGKEGSRGNESIRRTVIAGDQIYAEIGSSADYAAIHEYGGRTSRATIPQRAYLNPAVKDSETWIYNNLKMKLELAIRAAERVA